MHEHELHRLNQSQTLTWLLSLRSFRNECSPHIGQILRIMTYFVCLRIFSSSGESNDWLDELFVAGLHKRTIGCLRQYPALSNRAPSKAGLYLSSKEVAVFIFMVRTVDYQRLEGGWIVTSRQALDIMLFHPLTLWLHSIFFCYASWLRSSPRTLLRWKKTKLIYPNRLVSLLKILYQRMYLHNIIPRALSQ